MAFSPDYKPYVDLTLFDRQPHEIVQTALAQLAVNLPGWVQREADTAVALIEAMALQIAEDVYAINRLPRATMTGILMLKGFTPDIGAAATATARFTVGDSLGHTIPKGTRVRLTLGTAVHPTLDFLTTLDTVITPGHNTADIVIQAVENTDAPNNTPSSTALSFVTGAPFITTIVTTTIIGGGRLPEDGAAFIARASQGLQTSQALVTPSQFKAAVLSQPGVFRATVINNWDGNPGHTPGAQPGNVTIAVYGQGGIPISSGQKTALHDLVQADALVNLTIAVVDPTVTVVPVTATVVRSLDFSASDVRANVTAAIEAYLSTDTWMWGGTVHVEELEAVIDRALGVDYVQTVAAPAVDVVLTGAAPLAQAGTLTITVAN